VQFDGALFKPVVVPQRGHATETGDPLLGRSPAPRGYVPRGGPSPRRQR
jgi:hypothetical protein